MRETTEVLGSHIKSVAGQNRRTTPIFVLGGDDMAIVVVMRRMNVRQVIHRKRIQGLKRLWTTERSVDSMSLINELIVGSSISTPDSMKSIAVAKRPEKPGCLDSMRWAIAILVGLKRMAGPILVTQRNTNVPRRTTNMNQRDGVGILHNQSMKMNVRSNGMVMRSVTQIERMRRMFRILLDASSRCSLIMVIWWGGQASRRNLLANHSVVKSSIGTMNNHRESHRYFL